MQASELIQPQREANESRKDWLYPLLAFLLAAGVPLLAMPFENAPFNDDFSYARMARSVAETGRYSLDGWTSPIGGPLAYYGAAFIKLFGPSHVTLRFATLLLAGLTAALLYRLGRVAGLVPGAALQGALICMLSPVAIPVSASFMTDVPAMFMGVVAVGLALRAVEERGSAAVRTGWFFAFLTAGALAGTVRQTGWTLPLLLAPIVIWQAPVGRGMKGAWTALWAAASVGIVIVMKRHEAAAYALPENLGDTLRALVSRPVSYIELQVFRSIHCVMLMLLPAWVGLAVLARRIRLAVVLAAVVLLGALGWGFDRQGMFGVLLDPYLGNMVSPYGIMFPGLDVPGDKPIVLPVALLQAFGVGRWVLLGVVTVLAVSRWRAIGRGLAGLLSNRPLLYLAIFGGATAALSVMRIATYFGFDRYFLTALPAGVFALLLYRQRWVSVRPSRAGWAAVALFAGLGVGFTYDYHQSLRARLEAVDRLMAQGVPRHQISAGFELDAEAHLAVAGYLNAPTIRNPAGAYRRLRPNPAWPAPVESYFWFWAYTPSIQPRYLVARSPQPGYDPVPAEVIPYRRVFPLGAGDAVLWVLRLPAGTEEATPYLP